MQEGNKAYHIVGEVLWQDLFQEHTGKLVVVQDYAEIVLNDTRSIKVRAGTVIQPRGFPASSCKRLIVQTGRVANRLNGS